MCTNTGAWDSGKSTDFYFSCMTSILISMQSYYFSVLLVIKSHSIGTQQICDLLLTMILRKLFNENASLMQHFQCAPMPFRFNLWLLDFQYDDVSFTGDSAGKAATFHLLRKWIFTEPQSHRDHQVQPSAQSSHLEPVVCLGTE